MKLLQTVVIVATVLLAGTACRQIPPKPENMSLENMSIESGPLVSTAGNPATTQLDPFLRYLKGALSLTEQQTQELDKIFKENLAKREPLKKELQDLYKQRQERINTVLTQEQLEKYQQSRKAVPEHPGQPES